MVRMAEIDVFHFYCKLADQHSTPISILDKLFMDVKYIGPHYYDRPVIYVNTQRYNNREADIIIIGLLMAEKCKALRALLW